MQVEIPMPRLSDSMEEGKILQWLAEPGAHVSKGQPVVEIETDKATIIYEVETDGILVEILIRDGETAPVGATIALLETVGSAPKTDGGDPATVQAGRANASPIARRLARELDVDLAAVTGTGRGGMITKEDVEAAAGGSHAPAQQSPREPGRAEVQELTRVQRTIARRMVEAKVAPDFFLEVEVSMSAAIELRSALAANHDPPPSINDLVVKACATALAEFPRVNASFTERGFELHRQINIGVAVATEDALLVPVLKDADRSSLLEIAAQTRALARDARTGTLTPGDLEGGTFTVSNLGMFGIRRFTAIIDPPQAAILAVGEVAIRPAVSSDGKLVARETMSATLACDHRILYGADGARFLARVRELLEQRESLAPG